MILRLRIRGFRGFVAIGCDRAYSRPQVERKCARGRLGRAAGACRQRLRGERSLTRRGTYGSSPVSRRYAAGICRRRATPSFRRSASLCAFAVRAEIPRERPTSSFEHPAAMSATTSRWRSVSGASGAVVVFVMVAILPSLVRVIHSSAGVTPGVIAAGGGRARSLVHRAIMWCGPQASEDAPLRRPDRCGTTPARSARGGRDESA